jgi:phosphatidylinositol kinase/protein kinase (PI-3  family)
MDSIQMCRSLLDEGTEESIAQMWDILTSFFTHIEERLKKLDLILLPKVSEQLANKRSFKLFIPGREDTNSLIEWIEPALQVLGTQQHPRCLIIVTKGGERVKFLLKGNDDLRLDNRVMKFFGLVNSLLRRSKFTREDTAEIVEYTIVPLAPRAGLIRWIKGADTLHQIINDQRARRGVSETPEYDVLNEFSSGLFESLTTPAKMEAFAEVASRCDASELRDFLWSSSPNAVTWMNKTRRFCVTSALMSMIGYVIGVGDRHPSNIMIQRGTGRVNHLQYELSQEALYTGKCFVEIVMYM